MSYFEALKRCFLIAEIGVNHNGDMDLCRRLVDEAAEAGADAVKFQTFTADALVGRGTPKVRYQEQNTPEGESHYEMIRKLELPREEHPPLKAYCEERGVEFLSTPYDLESARFLDELGVKMFKTASADLVDLPLQERIASSGRPAIVSTGMATLGEVEAAVERYREAGNDDFILLHCVSNYPCSDESVNMRAMETLRRAFGCPVGWSDHTKGPQSAVLAVAFGAKVIEKHFTVDKALPGPDHRASSTPEEFAELVRSVRRAERMLGSPVKRPREEERQMAEVSRKSIVLARDMEEGDRIEAGDLAMKRPGSGLGAEHWDEVVGRKLNRSMDKESRIGWGDLQ